MRKLLTLTFLLTFLFSNLAFSKNTKLDFAQKYQNRIKWKFMNYDLPDGEWVYYNKYYFSVSTIQINCISFIQVKLKNLIGHYEICEINNGGKHANLLGMYLNQELKRGKYDSCMLRPEYYYTKFWSKGMSMNCFKIRHYSFDKEMNYPDDPDMPRKTYAIKKWIKDNNIIMPKILINASHEYFAPVVRDSGPAVYYSINPELYGGPKEKFFTEETSEYHRLNIDKYPKSKKFIDEFTSLSAKRHKEFEIKWKAKKAHKLDLSEVIIPQNDTTLIDADNDIVKQIKDLKELYDSGALTKEEFDKAKKKLLN